MRVATLVNIMEKNTPAKYLLHIKYNCGLRVNGSPLGPKDEWVIYAGEEVPRLGQSGFGTKNCHNHVSWQACEDEPCWASGGEVWAMENYSKERARELDLEEDQDIPLVHEIYADIKEIDIVSLRMREYSENFAQYRMEARYSSIETYFPKRIRKIEHRYSLSKDLKDRLVFTSKQEDALGDFGVPKPITNPLVRIDLLDGNLRELYDDLVLFFRHKTLPAP